MLCLFPPVLAFVIADCGMTSCVGQNIALFYNRFL